MAEEEEVAMEVEAVQAVYGEDCVVLDSYPPHLHLHIKPRTADISSQQFVESVIGIRAGPKYPEEPPVISLIDSKGLDEQRQKHLMSSVQEKASELSSSLMLVELCEEAVERLTIMNHPDGDCPLCLYPLVPADCQSKHLPFMKLMSCFHCFHCECIIRWWNWLHMQKEADSEDSSADTINHLGNSGDREGPTGKPRSADKSLGNCPVCRKFFHANDLKHVLDLVGAHSSQAELDSDATEGEDKDTLLKSDIENIRKEQFEAILKLQQERGGIVEPKKHISVVPGMFLPPSSTSNALTSPSAEEATEQQEQEPRATAETNSSNFTSNKTHSSQHHKSNRRKQRSQDHRRSTRQWVQKR